MRLRVKKTKQSAHCNLKYGGCILLFVLYHFSSSSSQSMQAMNLTMAFFGQPYANRKS